MTPDAMTLQQLSLAALVNLDRGFFEALTNAALKKVADDVYDRPGIKKARSVTIRLTFKPVLAADGGCDTVIAAYEIDHSEPAAVSNDLTLDIKPSGQLWFRGLSPENPAQQVLPMDYSEAEPPTDADPTFSGYSCPHGNDEETCPKCHPGAAD